MRQVNMLMVVPCVVFLSFGCSLATDFDDDKLEETVTYTLSENVNIDMVDGDAEPYPVDVTIQGNGIALISLFLENPIPDSQATEVSDTQLAALLGDEIGLIVKNNETDITANLTDGEKVDSTPTAPGQYRIAISKNRDEIGIEFRNETIDSLLLHEGGDYTAVIQVSPQAEFFETEEFDRSVNVSNAP